jgi:hypothetical protein
MASLYATSELGKTVSVEYWLDEIAASALTEWSKHRLDKNEEIRDLAQGNQ